MARTNHEAQPKHHSRFASFAHNTVSRVCRGCFDCNYNRLEQFYCMSNDHAYILTFGDASSHEYDIIIQHLRASSDLEPSIQTTFSIIHQHSPHALFLIQRLLGTIRFPYRLPSTPMTVCHYHHPLLLNVHSLLVLESAKADHGDYDNRMVS